MYKWTKYMEEYMKFGNYAKSLQLVGITNISEIFSPNINKI